MGVVGVRAADVGAAVGVEAAASVGAAGVCAPNGNAVAKAIAEAIAVSQPKRQVAR